MAAPLQLFDQVVEVSQDYLGPAAERFIDRQISAHLKKEPSQLQASDIDKLIDWIKLSFALLTKDTSLVDEYIKRLGLIARGRAEEAVDGQWQS